MDRTVERVRPARRRFRLVGGALAVLFVSGGVAAADPGDPDPAYGSGGIVTVDLGGHPGNVPIAAYGRTGKVVLAASDSTDVGAVSLIRLKPGGGLDKTFSGNGIVRTAFPLTAAARPQEVLVQPDGKIVVVGTVGSWSLLIARYLKDGSLDPAFATEGVATPDGWFPTAGAVLQTDGKIVVAAAWGDAASGEGGLRLVRYNADGTLDSAFGGDGETVEFLTAWLAPVDVALQSDGAILVAGRAGDPSTQTSAGLAVARFSSDGALDPTFGTAGQTLVLVDAGRATPSALAVGPDDQPSVVSWTAAGDYAVTHLLADGTLDAAFGDGGTVITDLGEGTARAQDAVVLPDDDLVVVGSAADDGGYAAVRYRPMGTLRRSFGSGGIAVTVVGGGRLEEATGAAVRPDGTVVAGGYAKEFRRYLVGVVAYLT